MKYNVPIHVRSSFNDKPGTLVTGEEGLEAVTVAGVAYDKNEAKVTMRGVEDQPGVVARIFGALAEGHISVDMIIQSPSRGDKDTTDVTFTVPQTELARVRGLIEEQAKGIGAQNRSHQL